MDFPSIPHHDLAHGPQDPVSDHDQISDTPTSSSNDKPSHRARIVRDALANIKKQMQRIVDVEAGHGGEAVPGWVVRDGKGRLSAYGHPAFVAAARKAKLALHLEEELENHELPPPLADGPFLRTLPELWRQRSLWGGKGLRALFMEVLLSTAPNRRLVYREDQRPEWWPADLRFASPTGAKALGVESTADFKAALIRLMESLYAYYGQPMLAEASPSAPEEPRPKTPEEPNFERILEDSRTPMGMAGRPSDACIAATSPTLQRAAKTGGGAQALVHSGPAFAKPSVSQPSKSGPSPKVPRKEPRKEVVSGAKAAPASTQPLDDSGHVATDDLLIKLVRIVRQERGEALSANSPPAALAVLHVREEAPFLRLPAGTDSAAQIHHMAAPEHWLVSGLVGGRVCVWDSARVGRPAALRRELAGLYGDVAGDADGVVAVGHFHPVVQSGGAVCGFLASAFLIDYALGLVPHHRHYRQDLAKAAVLEVVRTGRLRPCSSAMPPEMAKRARPTTEYSVVPWCCGETGGGELLAACDDCGRWWHVRDGCLRFMGPADRALFIREQRRLLNSADEAGPALVCCDRSASPTPSVHDAPDKDY